MLQHLRANLWLLILTLLLCSFVYPLLLLGVGQTLFHDQAQGSLVLDKDGKPVGSRLIAQPFTDNAPEYFQPRPSAASYNGAASGASNWGANNPLLRDRVARQLGPIVVFANGNRVGPVVQDWFREVADRSVQWAKQYPVLAGQWVKGDKVNSAFVEQWAKDHEGAQEFVDWRKENPDQTDPQPEDMAQPFFASFTREHPRSWPVQDDKDEQGKPLVDKDGKPTKRVKWVEVKPAADDENSDVQSYFFDFWLQNHADADLEQVPGDMVMASGSGLDPHITLDNARYQLKHRVADAWAKRILRERSDPLLKPRLDAAANKPEAERKQIEEMARKEIEAQERGKLELGSGKKLEERISGMIEPMLRRQAEAPFGGLVGVDLINVLEVNRALPALLEPLTR